MGMKRLFHNIRAKILRSPNYKLFLCLIITVSFTFIAVSIFFDQKRILDTFSLLFTRNFPSGHCAVPEINPWDIRVKPYIKQEKPIQCGKIQPFLTQLYDNGTLQWNYTELLRENINTTNINCSYQTFRKSNQNDYSVEQIISGSFNGTMNITDEFLSIRCTEKEKEIYSNLHYWIPPNKIPGNTDTIQDSQFPSIHIFLFDSMSQANFIRQLPKTYNTLVYTLKANVLSKIVSVGENTFPNMIPLFTGKRPDFPEDGLPECCKDFFDDWPFIWKDFSNIGYVTGWAEDNPNISTFNYLKKGFRKSPTHYYMRPFWLKHRKFPLRLKSQSWCFGNIPNYELLLTWLRKFQETMNSIQRPFFLMTVYSEPSHDYLNAPQIADEGLSEFLQHLHNSGNLNNTITIMMGDHGYRLGSYSNTALGRIERVMPFFSISLPPWLRSKYPHLNENLRMNEKRLVTFMDVYDALMDVITQRWDKPRKQWSRFGHSIWYPLPLHRGCGEAGIPIDYCPCNEEMSVEVDNPEVKNASAELMSYINSALNSYPQCVKLQLKQVVSAKRMSSYTDVTDEKPNYLTYVLRIVIETSPSNALFESILVTNSLKVGFHVFNSVHRINRYYNQSYCVTEGIIRNYCYCKIQMKNSTAT